MRALILGCGFVGLALGTALVKAGHQVLGVCRSLSAAAPLRAAGIEFHPGDITRPEQLAALPRDFDWLVNCVSSTHGSAREYRAVYRDGAQNLLRWLAHHPLQRIIHTSSTSVYGQTDGLLVTEASATEPASELSRILVETEAVLLEAAAAQRLPTVILRVAGIYGPGRTYWLQQFLAGTARLEGPGERWLNLIHRDDVVGAMLAALEHAPAGEIYNVVDDEPVTQRALFDWLAAELGVPLPPSVPAPEAADRKRRLTNKRVSNLKLRNELGYQLKYPTFREGYRPELSRVA